MNNRKMIVIWLLMLALSTLACNALSGAADPTEPAATAAAEATDVPATDTAVPPADEPTEAPTEVPTTTPSPDPVAGFIEFESESMGVLFSHPSDWVVEEEFEIISVVSDASLLEADTFESGAGIIILTEAEFGNVSAQEIFTRMIAEEGFVEDMTPTGLPQATTIQGHDSYQGAFTGEIDGSPVNVSMTAISGEGVGAVVLLISPSSGSEAEVAIGEAVVSTISLLPREAPQAEGEIDIGGTVSGQVASGSVSSWEFTASEGDLLTIIVEPEGDLDAVVDVLDASGASILPDGEVDDSFSREEISNLAIPASGTYQVAVTGWLDSAGGYTLSVLTTEVGETIPLSPGTSLEGTLLQSQQQRYSFTGIGSQPVNITVEPTDDSDVVVEIFDATGGLLLEVDDSFGREVAAFTPPADGMYTIVVSEWSGDPSAYTILLAAGDGSGLEGLPEAVLVLNQTDTLAAGATQSYAVEAAIYRPFTVVVDPVEDLDVVLEIYDSSNNLLEAQDRFFGLEQVTFYPQVSGTYVVRVSGFDASQSGNFDIAITQGGPEGIGAPGSVLIASSSLDPAEIHSYPWLTLDDGRVAALVVPDGELDVILEHVNDDTGDILEEIDASFDDERFVSGSMSEAYYTIDVSGFDVEQSGAYTITLFGSEDVAFELAGGDLVYGTMGDDSLIGFSYQGLAGETLIISVTSDSQLDAIVSIEPFEGDPYVEVDGAFAGGTETAEYTFDADETVFVFVSGFSGEVGSFSMTVEVE